MSGAISALVLAAGRGERLGGRKLELPCGRSTILGTVLDNLREAGLPALVVLGHEPERLEPIVASAGASSTVNERYDEGMLSSVICGLRALPPVDAALILPADHPYVRPATIRAVTACDPSTGLVIPTCRGRRGHPVLLAADLFEVVYDLDPNVGLRQLRDRVPQRVRLLPVDDPGILRDVDTPGDYDPGRGARPPA